LVDYCGFDGLDADVESGRDRINHVLITSPRVRRDE
jgi:chitinase